MQEFSYSQGRLHVEGVDLAALAAEVGTPAYVYSQAHLVRRYEAYSQAFADLDPIICFAVKANSNRGIMALFASLGGGADIVTGGELHRALAAGVDPGKIVYSGVGKTAPEMEAALKAGILMFNLESRQEMEALNRVAGQLGIKAPVSFRVNPDVDAQTHPKITTGLAKNKFGLDVETAHQAFLEAAELPNLLIKGISCHIGSQLTSVSPFADALQRLAALVERLKEAGIDLEILDLGGGLGITYNEETPPSVAEYAEALAGTVSRLGVRLVLEPGRSLVGNAGLLLTRVTYTKSTAAKNFVIVDAAMNDLMRPTLYDSFHAIRPVNEDAGSGETWVADVVGTICETGDFLARDRQMPKVAAGDLLAVMSAGAYGFSMSSQYNSRPRAAEVMVSGQRWAVVRKRETVDDLMRGEALPPWL